MHVQILSEGYFGLKRWGRDQSVEIMEQRNGANSGASSETRKIDVQRVSSATELEQIQLLFQEYAASLDFELWFQHFEEELRGLPGDYSPPKGCLLIATYQEDIAGCVAMRRLEKQICEMKRLYVRPPYRGFGIGRVLSVAIVAEARKSGYRCMRLDTVPSMKEARRLYASLGFREIRPYYHNPIPGVVFLELDLTSSSP